MHEQTTPSSEGCVGRASPRGRWRCPARTIYRLGLTQGRELVSEDLVTALSKNKGSGGGDKGGRGVKRSEAESFAVKCANGETFDGFQHDDFLVLPTSAIYYQLSTKDDHLNRDEFRDLVRLGRIRMIFNSIDTDNSGFVDRHELASKLQSDNELEDQLGLKSVSGNKVYTSLIYVNLFHQFDVNNDGKLSRVEFERMLTVSTEKAKEEASKQAEVAAAAAAAVSVS
jgi:Ca2+-binding EF-hand superfamily protein